jgi:hypothetical protein
MEILAKLWDSFVGHCYIVMLWILDMLFGPADE